MGKVESIVHFGRYLDVPCWAGSVEPGVEPPAGFVREKLAPGQIALSDDLLSLCGLAQQATYWEATSWHCPRCGKPTVAIKGERGKRCLRCKYDHYPHLHPAVIVLIRDGDRVLLDAEVLLGQGPVRSGGGFVDIGESLEAAARREIREEVGVEVRDLRYVASQYWPFPSQLMVGFVATYAGGEVRPDHTELEDARWFSVTDLPDLPGQHSIARFILDHYAATRRSRGRLSRLRPPRICAPLHPRRSIMPLVVITDCDHGTIAPEEAVLRAGGVEYRLHQAKTEDDVIAVARDADAIILQYAPITGRVLDGLPRCLVAVRYGVGVDTVDLAAATARGVMVANVPDYCIEEVSDHAIAMLLSLWRGVTAYDRAIRGGTWSTTARPPMPRLAGRVLGVIGVGRIGAQAARKASGLGMRVIGYDPYLSSLPAGIVKVTLDELLQQADAVTLHLPLTPESRHLVNEAALRKMKPTALLVNTARGGIVDTAALIRALQEGWIAGAALDTLEQEPVPRDSPLLSLPNVILNPHASWYSDQSVPELKRKTAETAVAVLRGQRPASVVNPDVFMQSDPAGPAGDHVAGC